jgi:hypothetical protein
MNEELAKRAVACKRWRWMPGMLTINGTRIQRTPNVEITAAWPDLDDPATLGCLLALVREAWGDPSLCANDAGAYDLMFWHVYTDDKFVSIGCQTEGEALVAALEAAP